MVDLSIYFVSVSDKPVQIQPLRVSSREQRHYYCHMCGKSNLQKRECKISNLYMCHIFTNTQDQNRNQFEILKFENPSVVWLVLVNVPPFLSQISHHSRCRPCVFRIAACQQMK